MDIALWTLLRQQPSKLLPPSVSTIDEVAAYPIGLFPAVSAGNAEWLFRTTHFGHLVGDVADETIQAVVRYMNAQYHYQALQQRHMDQVIDLAQTFQRGLSLRDTQIQGLNEDVAGRDNAIAQYELQVMEHGAEIVQRNTVIAFLQEQVHELQLELGDAMDHIGMLHEQPIPQLSQPSLQQKKKTQRRLREFQR